MKRDEPCPRCQSDEVVCHCQKTECLSCGNPVGNPTFTKCDDCFRKLAKKGEQNNDNHCNRF